MTAGPELIETLVHDIDEQLERTIAARDRARVMVVVRQCLTSRLAEAGSTALGVDASLPVAMMKPAEIISKGVVPMSQATLYRAVENGRFYCVIPAGKAIGRAFPAWQFIAPVPELLPVVLGDMMDLPGSEIHAFWVTPVDVFDDLTPAEVLAGKPFETRAALSAAQRRHLGHSPSERQRAVQAQLRDLPWRGSGGMS